MPDVSLADLREKPCSTSFAIVAFIFLRHFEQLTFRIFLAEYETNSNVQNPKQENGMNCVSSLLSLEFQISGF
jgi:hypothetical protein